MNSLADAAPGGQKSLPASVQGTATLFGVPPEIPVLPLEFRSMDEGGASEQVSPPPGEAGSPEVDPVAEAARLAALSAARDEGMKLGEHEGYRRARAEMEAETLAAAARERQRVAGVLQEFRVERQRYFAEVEREVVRLALAIAARVLHREAQMDGLLLAGAVRVALETIADAGSVVLRAPPAEVAQWEQALRGDAQGERPRVMADATLSRGDCVVETPMGTVELGVRAQLEEIERGFFDLLSHRPDRAAHTSANSNGGPAR